jgi:hypothetical protein
LLDALLHRLARCRRDLELHRALGLVLHHDGASSDLVAMADVSYPEGHKITATQLTLNGALWPTILPLFHGSR